MADASTSTSSRKLTAAAVVLAARRHWLDGAKMETLARSLGVSRTKLTRALEREREGGTYSIEVHLESAGTADERIRGLEARFGLRIHLVPASSSMSDEVGQERVARTAARHIGALLRPGMTLGLGAGHLVEQAAVFFQPRPCPGLIVCALAAVDDDRQNAAVTALHQVSRRVWGRVIELPLPAPIEDPDLRAALLGHKVLQPLLASWDALDVAVVDLDPRHDGTQLTGEAVPDPTAVVRHQSGAGPSKRSLFGEATIGISLTQFRQADQRICLAASERAADEVEDWLRRGLLTDLIATAPVVERVIELLCNVLDSAHQSDRDHTTALPDVSRR